MNGRWYYTCTGYYGTRVHFRCYLYLIDMGITCKNWLINIFQTKQGKITRHIDAFANMLPRVAINRVIESKRSRVAQVVFIYKQMFA